jgi:hypothetical protein
VIGGKGMATKEKIKSEAMKEVKHMQSKSDGTKDMKQMQRSKGKGWDGKSRPSDDNYRKRWNDIFGKKEEVELKESYEQSKRNKEERK